MQCACTYENGKITGVCAAHAQHTREQSRDVIERLERALVEALSKGAHVRNWGAALHPQDDGFEVEDFGCGCCSGELRASDVAPQVFDVWREVYERRTVTPPLD